MASLAKKLLGGFATAALFVTPTAACAEENTASTAATEVVNQNVSTASTSVSTTQQGSFKSFDMTTLTPDYIIQAALSNNSNKNFLIAWGGNTALQEESFQGIKAFSEDNPDLNIVFIVGPDRDGYSGDIDLEFLAQGAESTRIGKHGIAQIENLQQSVYTLADRNFGSANVASLTLNQ